MTSPTFTDILRAKQTIARYLPRTPLCHYPALEKIMGARVLVKHENHQLTGAFKVRGGINLISQLSAEERERGVITASTGNHGQSVAYAASLFGVRATVVAPEKSNPLKVAAMRDLGAEVMFHGADFDAAREQCELLSKRENLRYIHSANEPLLIAGVATIALEILEDAPEVTTIIVPIGGGSGAAGACLVAKTFNPQIKVIGVQAERAPAAYNSWRAHELLEDKMETGAEGLATRTAFELTQRILWQHLRMQPGDCLVFQAMIVHGAPGNTGQHRRRALSTRWAGDDARYYRRPGEIAIPTEDPGLPHGERLDCERFPLVWTA